MTDFFGWLWNMNAYVAVVLIGIAGVVLVAAVFAAARFGRDLGSAFAKGWRQERPGRN